MTQTLTLDEYQTRAGETAIYPEKGTGSALALAYVGLGLGEAGEVQNKIKKVIRDDGGALRPEVAAALAKEYGDLLWYVANGVTELGLTLGEVAAGNLDKLAARKAIGALGGSGDDREKPQAPPSQAPTVADLDGSDDAADWITPGHVLSPEEVVYLRSLHLPA